MCIESWDRRSLDWCLGMFTNQKQFFQICTGDCIESATSKYYINEVSPLLFRPIFLSRHWHWFWCHCHDDCTRIPMLQHHCNWHWPIFCWASNYKHQSRANVWTNFCMQHRLQSDLHRWATVASSLQFHSHQSSILWGGKQGAKRACELRQTHLYPTLWTAHWRCSPMPITRRPFHRHIAKWFIAPFHCSLCWTPNLSDSSLRCVYQRHKCRQL